MEMKSALLVAALTAAAVLTVGCEQRNANDTAGKSAANPPASNMQAQTTPSAPSGTTNTPPETSSASGSMSANNAPASNSAANSVANAADDAAITAKVKAAILAEPGLKSLSINVDTKDATVTLSGNVASDQLRDRAKQIAMSTQGVKNVVDNLSVKAS